VVVEFQVLEVREETDEIQDLAARPFWLFESEESKRRREVSETPSNVRHEGGHMEIVYSEFLEVRKCGKVTQGTSAKPHGSELIIVPQADSESLDEWK